MRIKGTVQSHVKANTTWKVSKPHLGGKIFYPLIVTIMDLLQATLYQCSVYSLRTVTYLKCQRFDALLLFQQNTKVYPEFQEEENSQYCLRLTLHKSPENFLIGKNAEIPGCQISLLLGVYLLFAFLGFSLFLMVQYK